MTRSLPTVRVPALLGAMALATIAWMFAMPPEAAAALAPVQTAWWTVANQPGSPKDLPPPPDVHTDKHDLFVEGAGGTGGPLPGPVPPVNNAQGGAQALAAIHYSIPEGAAVQKLTLKVTGNKPPSIGVVACLITDLAFKSEDNGPGSDIPKYDCGTQAAGKPNGAGDAVEFTDIGKLVKGSELLLMLVPGRLDRVVFSQPDATSLQASSGPPASTFSAPADTLFAAAPAPAADTGAGSTGSAVSAPAPVLAPIGEPPLPAPLPTKAPAAGAARRILGTRPATVGSSRIPLSPQQTRLVVGVATLASIAAFAAMVVLGPRMNAASAAALSADGANVRGVGRFARPRTGSAPRIW
ncbi:MAG: hypothetical protein M3010_02470 [Candidatus Dormibacteraeota bacterium]|nr:hypothetical protein [Candidatus Dormibacteraeota bacterium]